MRDRSGDVYLGLTVLHQVESKGNMTGKWPHWKVRCNTCNREFVRSGDGIEKAKWCQKCNIKKNVMRVNKWP
jgi:hypothetical protein